MLSLGRTLDGETLDTVEYAYDSNGNRTLDSRTGLEFTCNLLNLPCEVRVGPDPAYYEEGFGEGDVVSAFEYYADGTLHGIIDGQGGFLENNCTNQSLFAIFSVLR